MKKKQTGTSPVTERTAARETPLTPLRTIGRDQIKGTQQHLYCTGGFKEGPNKMFYFPKI